MIGLQFLDGVRAKAQVVADEFEQLTAGVRGFLFTEHHDDGTHADITADSVAADTGDFGELDSDSGTTTGRHVGCIDAAELRLTPGNTYTVLANDENLLKQASTQAAGPHETLWHLSAAATRTVLGIWTARKNDPDAEVDGQVLVLVNDSAYTITFLSGQLPGDARKVLGCDAPGVALVAGAIAIFVYDDVDDGWRLVSLSKTDSTYPGLIAFQGMATVQPGWLVCDGSVKAQTDYPGLYAAIGSTWNTGGEGAGNFRLPPGGVFPIATGGTPALAVGALGGTWNHAHAAGSLAAASDGAHTHDVTGNTGNESAHTHSTPAHTHNFTTDASAATEDVESTITSTPADVSPDSHVHTGTTDNDGAGTSGAGSAHSHDAGTLAAASDGAHTHSVSGTSGTANPPYAALVMVIHT